MDINLEPWSAFFGLGGAAAATLAGLLFVGLSLNREKLAHGEQKKMLRLGQRCFADYLFVLFVCAVCLVPKLDNQTMAVVLFFLGLQRTLRLFRHARDIWHEAKENKARGLIMRNFLVSVFGALNLMGVSVAYYQGKNWAPYLIAPMVIALLASASWSAWLMLVVEKEYAKRA